jgi:hypothetical protein
VAEALRSELLDEDFLRWVAEHTTAEERAKYGPLLKAQAEQNARLSLQAKQQLAEELSAQADELLYGGAAGSGKSEWLIRHCARQMLRYPGNRGVIFRRVFPSLNRTIIPRATLLLKPWATYNKVEHTFYFHNGSVLELASTTSRLSTRLTMLW